MIMNFSLRTSLISALIFASLALPGIVVADTFCYPDGCAKINIAFTKNDFENRYGKSSTLAQAFEAMTQIVLDNPGHYGLIWGLSKDATGKTLFLGCGNGSTLAAVYKCSYQYICRGSDLVDYCGNVSHCTNGCSDNACVVTSTSTSTCPPGYDQQGDQCVFSACPSGYVDDGNHNCVLSNQCATPPVCQGNDLVNSCTRAVIQTCAYGCITSGSIGVCRYIPTPSATLKVIPLLVHPGDTTVVSWTSQSVTSCTVHGTNGDSWTSTFSGIPGRTSSPIQGQTIYTLHCIAFPGATPATIDKTTTVNIVPSEREK